MPLRVFNTLANEKQDFTPLRPGRIGIYVCGITVYDLTHIGHARMLTAFDVMVRFLRWAGWEVAFVRNWTDVDDKIIRRALERGQDPRQLSEHFIDECRHDMQSLGVMSADVEPKATDHIPDVHGGGKDLVFPHHENEIAQSEAASGQDLAHYWLHNGFITIDAEKMSKSLGNFRTIRDLLAHWDGEALRAFLLSTHYRHPINFAEAAVLEADRRVDYF